MWSWISVIWPGRQTTAEIEKAASVWSVWPV